MKLPTFTRIIREDMPFKVQKWIDKLISPLNSFMLTVRNGLNKGMTINDNMAGAIKKVLVRGNAVEFAYKSTRVPQAVIVGYWRDVTSASWTPTTAKIEHSDYADGASPVVTVTSGVTLSWSFTNDAISCVFYGLDSTHTYSVNLIIFED